MAKAPDQIRANEIQFLQEQNNTILASLERCEHERDHAHEQIRSCEEKDAELQQELQTVRDKISSVAYRLQQEKSETVSKDEHVRVLSEQNNQMLALLEAEETKNKEHSDNMKKLESRNKKLQVIAGEFDTAKAALEKQVQEAKSKCADTVAHVKGQRSMNETLRANIQNTEAKTRVEIEALGQALQVVEQKNLEYMARVNRQEVKEQQLQAETATMKEEVETIREEIDKLRQQLEGDEEGRSHFERARSQLEMSIEAMEVQADTLKKALSTAERANEQLQEENRTGSERCRETADKVYALMDSLRLNQVELKKQEAENHARDRKIISLERTTQNLQAKISMECDAKVLAEQERKEAEQESIMLKKKNKRLEESVTASQQAQDKAEKDIHEMNDRVSQLQTQNAYLASRIDGQDEEKNALKADISVIHIKTKDLAADNTQMRDEIDKMEEEVANAVNDKDQFQQELEYIKREDVLDEAGRQRPILIQSTDSDLVEKLQINEFLYEAQQARNPVPPMIEKIAQLLAMLHEGQDRSDQCLADLSKSNSLVSAMRQRNMALFTRTQMFESFKTRALLRYVMNLVEGEQASDLHLDGLSFGPRELKEMDLLLKRYEANDKVFTVSLIDNALDEDSVNQLLQLIFSLPYLRAIDLRRNCFGTAEIKKFEEQLKGMEGVTTVIKTANGVLNVHSGNQLRMSIDLGEQIKKEHVAKEVDFTVQRELSHQDADPFLSTAPGESAHPWAQKTAAAQRSPAVQVGAVPDPSSVELKKVSATGAAQEICGPPVGLGGPGNVAALNKAKKGDKLPDPKKRQAKRAKGAPPPVLEYEPAKEQRSLDRSQTSGFYRQSSGLTRASSQRSASPWGPSPPQESAAPRTMSSMDRAISMPALRQAIRPPRAR